MRYLLDLKSEIENVREELNAAAKNGLQGLECYQKSIYLDKLIADYMELEHESIGLLDCG